MKKMLVILTCKYPYDFGEPFLESEIYKHLPYYDKIMVLAQDVGKESRQTRVLPERIECRKTARGKRRNLRILDVARAPKLLLFPDAPIRTELKNRKLNALQHGFLCYFESRCLRLLEEAKAILRDVPVEQYDQISLYSYWLFANANVAIMLKDYLLRERQYKGRVVVFSRAHRYDIYEEANKLNYLPFRERMLQQLDAVYPCSRDGTEYLKKMDKNGICEIKTSYLGSRDYGLAPFESDSDCFHIVTCSRVVKVKRLELLIDELAMLNQDRKIIWTHIGGGVEGKTKYFDSIRKYAEEKLKNSKNIFFEFLGSMPNQEVYEYYKLHQVDLFVNCSYSEGLPVSLMEASSFGIPLIATDVGGSREIIEQDKNGFLIGRDFEKGKLAEIISMLADEPIEERFNRRKAARALWEKNYFAEKNYTKFASILSQM